VIANPRKRAGKARLTEKILVVVQGHVVCADRNADPSTEHIAEGSNSIPQSQVAARIVNDTGPACCEQLDLILTKPDAMSEARPV
jgi:ACT domain-containing protein